MDKKPAAGLARSLLSILGFLLLIIGTVVFFVGLLIFIGVNLINMLIPKSLSSTLLPSDTTFIEAFSMIAGVSMIVISRLFHTSGKWLKRNERKGAILAILLSAVSLAGLFFAAVSLNLTIIGDIIYLLIVLYLAIIISVIMGWKQMYGGLEEVFPGVGYFLAAGFFIFILFTFLYILFPVQSLSISNISTQSLFSVFTGSFGYSNVHSAHLNYSYPNSLVNINLNGVLGSAGSLLSVTNSSNAKTDNLTKILHNTSINLLLPVQFILSSIGNSPQFASNLKSFNVTDYLKQNSSQNARKYLEGYFPELSQFYFIVTGREIINSSNNVSIFDLSPSKLIVYLKKYNITAVNSSFPINVTKYMLSNATYNKSFGKYLPSQLLLVNMSNHVGVQIIYSGNKIFNISRIPFSSAQMSMYVTNSTICFEFGADFSNKTESEFSLSSLYIQRTIKCN